MVQQKRLKGNDEAHYKNAPVLLGESKKNWSIQKLTHVPARSPKLTHAQSSIA
jgi:hypothetical protein